MRTKLSILFACCVMFLTGMAQEKPPGVDIKVGPTVKLGKKELVDKILGKDENGFYVISVYNGQITTSYFNNDLDLVKKGVTKLKHGKLDQLYKLFIPMGEDYYLFTTTRDKKAKMTTLYVQRLNKNTLMLEAPKKLAQESYEGYKKKASASFGYSISADSNYLMFVIDLPTNKGDNDRMGLLVYDKDLNEVWKKKEIVLPDLEEEFSRYDCFIGNDAKAYVLGRVFDSVEGKGLKKTFNYHFDLLIFQDDDEEAERFEIKLDERYLSDLNMKLKSNGELQVIGFYSTDGYGQNGVFNKIIDLEDYSTVYESYNEFPTDFIVQHSSEKAKKKAAKKEKKGKEVQAYSYNIDDVIENPDGSITMIGEQFRFYVTSSTDANGNTTYTYHYIYGNIILVQFDPVGDVSWMELIPKYQHTTNDGGYYSGYALVRLGDGSLKMIFNDSPKNNYYDSSGKFYGWKKSRKHTEIVMYDISLDGELKRYTLVKAGEEQILSRPKVSIQTQDNELIILNMAKKLTRFAKVSF